MEQTLSRALAIAAVLGLLSLSPTGVAQAQLASQPVSIALSAHAAPGVRLGAGGTAGSHGALAGELGPGTMRVNTSFRVELHRSAGAPRVVLLRQDKAGLVPWEAIRAKLALPADVAGRGVEPVVLDLVVCPQL